MDLSVGIASSTGLPVFIEPLALLLKCYLKSITVLSRQKKRPETNIETDHFMLESAGRVVSVLIQRFAKADLEDFELDKSAELSVTSIAGHRNLLCAIALQSCYEVCQLSSFFPHDDN
jgi:hypothetical protein